MFYVKNLGRRGCSAGDNSLTPNLMNKEHFTCTYNTVEYTRICTFFFSPQLRISRWGICTFSSHLIIHLLPPNPYSRSPPPSLLQSTQPMRRRRKGGSLRSTAFSPSNHSRSHFFAHYKYKYRPSLLHEQEYKRHISSASYP